MILGCLAVYGLCWRLPQVMAFAGVSNEGVWFLDTYAILAALDAKRQGLDPYVYNPLNYFGGTHVYSDWWFALVPLPLTRADSLWLGGLVIAAALVAAWSVLKPRNWREVAWSLAVLCSAPVILGLNRANMDFLFFAILSGCVPAMLSRVQWRRVTVAPVLVAFATGLKYYPAVAGLIVLAARGIRERLVAVGVMAGLLVCVGISVAPSLSHYTSDQLPGGLYTFGSLVSLRAAGLSNTAAVGCTVLLLAGAGGWIALAILRRSWKTRVEQPRDYYFFILGAVLLTGSFVATVNYGYRWLYAVWMIPFLCRANAAEENGAVNRLLFLTRLLLAVALWSDVCVAMILNQTVHSLAVANRWIGLFSALQQPVIWGLFVCLSGWLVHFVGVQLTLFSAGNGRPVAATGS